MTQGARLEARGESWMERMWIPLGEYNLSLRAAMEAGDEITWSRLLSKYRVCDHGAQLICGEKCTHEGPKVGIHFAPDGSASVSEK